MNATTVAADIGRAVAHGRTEPDAEAASKAYLAQDAVIRRFGWGDPIPASTLPLWIADVVERAFPTTGAPFTEPALALDVDEPGVFGQVEGEVIHLDPRALYPSAVLHEVSHWMVAERHSPVWAGAFVKLCRAGIGDDFADALDAEFRTRGVMPPRRKEP